VRSRKNKVRENTHPVRFTNDYLPQLLCAGAAGSISQLIFYPTSTSLTRIQVNTTPLRSFEDLKRVVFGNAYQEGLSARFASIYSGFMLAGTYKIAARSLKYGLQPTVASFLSHHYGEQARTNLGELQGKALLEALAGGSIGMFEVLFFHALDTIKIKRQGGDRTPFVKLIRQDPIKLYNGAGITMARNFTSFSVLFGVSSMLMSLMGYQNTREANLKERFGAAATAAGVSVVVTNPLDVIKTRIQSAPLRVSTLSMFRNVCHSEGLFAFYKGISLRIFTSLPKKALPMVLTGYFLDLWQKQQAHHENQPVQYASGHKPG